MKPRPIALLKVLSAINSNSFEYPNIGGYIIANSSNIVVENDTCIADSAISIHSFNISSL